MHNSTEQTNAPQKASKRSSTSEALLLAGLAIFSFAAVMALPDKLPFSFNPHNTATRQHALLTAVHSNQIFGLTVAEILTKFGEPDTQAVSKKDGLTVMTYECQTGVKGQPWLNIGVQGGKAFAVWNSSTAEEGAKAIEQADRNP